MIVSVDLAARYSAAQLLGDGGEVLASWDSWNTPEDLFLRYITVPFIEVGDGSSAQVLVVEDLPASLNYSNIIKRVARLQGRLAGRMDDLGALDKLAFVPPALWMQDYKDEDGKHLIWRLGPSAIIDVARERYGYVAPVRPLNYKGAERTKARKVVSDYCASYLIGQWARRIQSEGGSVFDQKNVTRYQPWEAA